MDSSAVDKQLLQDCLRKIIGPGLAYKNGIILAKETGISKGLLREAMLAGEYNVHTVVTALKPALVKAGIWDKECQVLARYLSGTGPNTERSA